MFFSQGTPDTSSYMIAGYVIFFVITAIYVVSLVIRERNLNRDLATLETMKEEQQAAAAPVAVPAASPAQPKAAKSSGSKKQAKKSRRKQ